MTDEQGEDPTQPVTISQRVNAFRKALRAYWRSPLFDGIGPDGPEAPEWHTVRESDHPVVGRTVQALADAARSLAAAAAGRYDTRPLLTLARLLERGVRFLGQGVSECYAPTEEVEVLVEAIELGTESGDGQASHGSTSRKEAQVQLDVVADPGCVSLRDILRSGPKLLKAIEKDQRSPSRRKASDLLKAMQKRGMVSQTRHRGPWRFVSDTPTQ